MSTQHQTIKASNTLCCFCEKLNTSLFFIFSETEKNGWVTKVNSYVDVVTNQIKKENIFHAMYLHAFMHYNEKKRKVKELLDKNPTFEFHHDNVNFEEYEEYDGDYYKDQGKTESVSHLHTGSIPSMFGKPLMVLGEIPPSIVRSHLEIASDHDVMIVLDNMPVAELDGRFFK